MTRLLFVLALALAVPMALVADEIKKIDIKKPDASKDDKKDDKKEEKFDAKKLEGKWTFVEGSKNGDKFDATNIKEPVVITKDKITMATPDATFEFKYTLDEKTSPVGIDLEITSETFKGTKTAGIIKFDGDKLVLAYGVDLEDPTKTPARPKDFAGKKDSKSFSFTMKKEEKKEDKKVEKADK